MIAIVAVAADWGIGYQNRLLFSSAQDRRQVRRLTEGKTLVMGRKTFASLPGGKSLPGRPHVVLSRSPDFAPPGVTVCRDLTDLAARLRDIPSEDRVNFGGQEIYRLLLPYCQRAYVTKFDALKPADSFFPKLDDLPGWVCVEETPAPVSEDPPLRFCVYEQPAVQVL